MSHKRKWGPRQQAKDDRILFNSRFAKLHDAERRDLEEMLVCSPVLHEAYWFVQLLYDVYDDNCSAEVAEERVRTAWNALSLDAQVHFKGFGADLYSNSQELFAYWRSRTTNARAEAANRTLRDLQRAARGLSFTELRRRAVYTISPSKLLATQRQYRLAPNGHKTSSRHGLHKSGPNHREMLPRQYKLIDLE